MQKFPHWTNCIRLSRIALSFVDAYIHTYLPTYIHTWTYENMNLVLVRIHCQLAGITVATGPRPIYAINPILMQQTAPERTDSRRNQGFCGGHRIRSLNASNDQPFVGPWLPGLPHLDPGMVQIVASMGLQNQSCYSLKHVEFWRIAKAMWACLKKG